MSDAEDTPPTCMHCHGELRLGRDSGRWFHLNTQRYDCLRSPFDDSPYTMAAPEPEWIARHDTPSH